MAIGKPLSISQIRSAIEKLSQRARLAHNEGRSDDGAAIELRAQAYRDELGRRP